MKKKVIIAAVGDILMWRNQSPIKSAQLAPVIPDSTVRMSLPAI